MCQTNSISPERIIKVINRMEDLRFSGLEIGEGDRIVIDIEFTGIDPDARKEGYVFVDVKKHIAADVLSKAKIGFSRTTTETDGVRMIRLVVYPPRDSRFVLE